MLTIPQDDLTLDLQHSHLSIVRPILISQPLQTLLPPRDSHSHMQNRTSVNLVKSWGKLSYLKQSICSNTLGSIIVDPPQWIALCGVCAPECAGMCVREHTEKPEENTACLALPLSALLP